MTRRLGDEIGKVYMDYWPMLCNRDRVLNAGVDINGFAPVTFEELFENNRCWKYANFVTTVQETDKL